MLLLKAIVVCVAVFISSSSCSVQGSEEIGHNAYNTLKYVKATQTGEAWCEVCVLVLDRVKVIVNRKDAKGEINQTLYSMCDMINGFMRHQCYEMVPKIEKQIQKGLNPEKACEMLSFCGEGDSLRLVQSFAAKLNEHPELSVDISNMMEKATPHFEKLMQNYHTNDPMVGESLPCTLCKIAVGLVDKNLDKYKKPILRAVMEICNDLPSPTNKACSDAMSYYIPKWWDEFFDNVASADKICYTLRICKEET